MLASGCLGLNFTHEAANKFLDEWEITAKNGSFIGAWINDNLEVSPDLRVRGHRHDQTAASVIACKLGMDLLPIHTFFGYYEWHMVYKENKDLVKNHCLLCQGM
jgi:hypothetical protein